MLSREILAAQEEAVAKDSIDLTSLLVYPLLAGSLFFNLAVGGRMLKSGELPNLVDSLPNLSPLISLAIDQLNQQPLEDQGFDDVSKIDHIESKVDQDFSDFDLVDNFPAGYDSIDGNSGEDPPLLQLTNLLTTKLLNNLGDDVVWPRIKEMEEMVEEEEQNMVARDDPIRILKKIRKEKESVFGKKKQYVRRKHINHMRDK